MSCWIHASLTFRHEQSHGRPYETCYAIAYGFHEKSPEMPPYIVGAIDCKEVVISPPHEDPSSYFNRKHFYSIKLQADVDDLGRFLDISVGWPG